MDRLISLKYAAKPALLPTPNVSPRYGRLPALLPTPNVSPRYGRIPALLPTPNVSPRYGWRPALPTIEERDEARADPLPALTVEPEQQCEGINNLEDLKGPQTKKKRWGFSFFTKKKQSSNKTGCWTVQKRDEARADPLPAPNVEPEQQCEGINNLEDLKGPQTKKKRWGFSFFTKKKQENSNKTGCWSWLRCNKRARESNLEESVVQ
ncbi:hypothetical protein VZT92_004557 [Zoarces viviparus]|uniref:Uncharacterized protein n=1 Tax=Zoarces viviparus TaxID=48416 RepID=A0AAW1FWS2_ZOAVI